jgi:hypothetical protein
VGQRDDSGVSRWSVRRGRRRPLCGGAAARFPILGWSWGENLLHPRSSLLLHGYLARGSKATKLRAARSLVSFYSAFLSFSLFCALSHYPLCPYNFTRTSRNPTAAGVRNGSWPSEKASSSTMPSLSLTHCSSSHTHISRSKSTSVPAAS